MTDAIRRALAWGSHRLLAAGIDSARLDARILLSRALGRAPESIFVTDKIDAAELKIFDELIRRRVAREPLAYIAGSKEFWNLDFAVGPGVLIPRPETETLVEQALSAFPDLSEAVYVLDIGTGCGCLLIAFLVERNLAQGVGIDTSASALAFAQVNAQKHGIDRRCRFFQATWEPPEGLFDVILANPPYLSECEFAWAQPEIRVHEPREAFVAGWDGLEAARMLAPVLARRLRQKGLAFLEIGMGQTEPVREILATHSLDVRKVIPDLSGVARCLMVGRQERH